MMFGDACSKKSEACTEAVVDGSSDRAWRMLLVLTVELRISPVVRVPTNFFSRDQGIVYIFWSSS